MSALRIQFFTQICHPAGTYFRFHNLAIGLARLGHDVTVYAGDADSRGAPRTETRDGITYHATPDWRGARWFGQGTHPGSALARALATYPPADVVHLFQPFPSGAAAWRAAAREAAVRCFDWDDLWVGGILNGGPASARDAWVRLAVGALERRLPAAADHVTTCSAMLAALARERGARDASVIPNGFWPAPAPPRAQARARLGLPAAAPLLGFMGFAHGELEWCVTALDAARRRHPALRLVLCGSHAATVAALAPEQREGVIDLGALPPADIPGFVAAIDLGLLPLADTPFNRSRFPIKFAEYLGGGAPVLLSDVGECAARARGMPWVLRADASRDGWIAAFAEAAGRAAVGTLPAVDPAAVAAALSWEHAARGLAATYGALLERR